MASNLGPGIDFLGLNDKYPPDGQKSQYGAFRTPEGIEPEDRQEMAGNVEAYAMEYTSGGAVKSNTRIQSGRGRGKVRVMTIEEIKKICEKSDFSYFGLRADDMEYQIGDICNNSHQLFQDPDFDEFGELIYPEVEDTESPYYGFYDAGELNGTCAVGFNPDSEEDTQDALEAVKMYSGKNLYIIAGDSIEYGNDEGEIIIKDAAVLGRL